MSSNTISINEIRLTNRTADDMNVVLEPEGDVIQIPNGKTCQIKAEMAHKTLVDCEFEYGANGEITLYLAVTKQVFVDGERIR